jgi:hypothetical protein
MFEPKHKVRSALSRAATTMPTAMAVELQIDDLRALRPEWSHAQTCEFVSRHGPVIAAAAIAGALEAAKRIIELGDRDAVQ